MSSFCFQTHLIFLALSSVSLQLQPHVAPLLSCPVTQHACLTWSLTGLAPVRVQGLRLGHPVVTQRLVGCHSAPSTLGRSQSFPPWRGRPLIPPCPISDSAGLPDSSDRQAWSLCAGVWIFWFALANCTSSAESKQGSELLLEEYIFSTAETVYFWLSLLSPGLCIFFSSLNRAIESELSGAS